MGAKPPAALDYDRAMAARTSATQRVFDTLREEILTGRLAPGTQHSIYRLAERLEVSRTPVREAVLRLADLGLVAVERNRGVRIRAVTAKDVLEVFELRLLLEVPATAFTALHADVDHRDRMRAALTAMTQAAGVDVRAFDDADRALHRAIHDAAGNERVAEVVLAHRASIQARGATTVHRSRDPQQILAEHVPIVEAILGADAARAASLMREHLMHTAELLVGQLDEAVDVHAWRTRVDALLGDDPGSLESVESTPGAVTRGGDPG